MRADDRHCVADGGRLELGDRVLDGAGKGWGKQRDDEQHADERRNRSGRVADDQAQPDCQQSQHRQVEAAANNRTQYAGLSNRSVRSRPR